MVLLDGYQSDIYMVRTEKRGNHVRNQLNNVMIAYLWYIQTVL